MAGCSLAKPLLQPGTGIFAQPCTCVNLARAELGTYEMRHLYKEVEGRGGILTLTSASETAFWRWRSGSFFA